MFQSSQRLRQRMESQPKRIAPRKLGDASVLTERLRFASSKRTGAPQTAGASLVLSSEFVTAGRAHCAVCDTPATSREVYVQKDCCGLPSTAGPKALALQGICKSVCPVFNGPQPVLPSADCCRPGFNTAWAVGLLPGSRGLLGQIPAISRGCTACHTEPATTVEVRCDCSAFTDVSGSPIELDPCTGCIKGSIPPASAFSIVPLVPPV